MEPTLLEKIEMAERELAIAEDEIVAANAKKEEAANKLVILKGRRESALNGATHIMGTIRAVENIVKTVKSSPLYGSSAIEQLAALSDVLTALHKRAVRVEKYGV